MLKPYRLLAEGTTLNYATREERDANAQRMADETGQWVGLEVRRAGEWWLEQVVLPVPAAG